MAKVKTTDVTAKIVDLLTPLNSVDRQRIIQASFVLLGETPITQKKDDGGGDDKNLNNDDANGISRQAKNWMKQNSITVDQLQQVFHLADGNAEVIASEIPGKDVKSKTINAYILKGISRMLSTGDSGFDDKSARALCKNSGCYSDANHSVYIKAKGNKLTGSKDAGWKLTAPGMKFGADLVKQVIGGND